ncbi:MAG: hypothetical protein IH899_15680, partial [Planctomycetes bacterium]|nr:hypothetical protein [Planctomycetota bacterium]
MKPATLIKRMSLSRSDSHIGRFSMVACVAYLLAMVFMLQPLQAAEKASAGATFLQAAKLHVSPAKIQLGGANRKQQLLITAETAGGSLFDVTARCELSVADKSVAATDGSLLSGIVDGKTELLVRFQSIEKRVPVTVAGFNTYPPINFLNDVIPVFSKLGCNSGGCHGKQSGQNGFRLSVFGSEPEHDYVSLVKESRGRRIFPGDPERSLLVAKTIGRVAHGGGRRTQPGSSDHVLLAEWIRQGMPWGDDNAATLKSIRIEPSDRMMSMASQQQILVTAVYSDGSERDVTAATTY